MIRMFTKLSFHTAVYTLFKFLNTIDCVMIVDNEFIKIGKIFSVQIEFLFSSLCWIASLINATKTIFETLFYLFH
jgi:hypothetical protein